MRRLLLLVALAATVLAGGILTGETPEAVAAKPTTTTSPPPQTTGFTIDPQGVYLSPATAQITGQVRCQGGAGTLTFTNPAGTPYAIAGEIAVVCDGTVQRWEATITSPSGSFTPGGFYLVHGALTAPSGTAGGIGKVVLL